MTGAAEQGDAERWRRLEAILDEALDRPPAAQPAFLDRACGSDAALRREIEALLAEMEAAAADSFLEQPVGVYAGGLVREALRPRGSSEPAADPVVGWLVCVRGPDRGRDFSLHAGRTFIGRGEDMPVRLAGDRAVSREQHAVVSYDPRHRRFKIMPGDAAALTYLNGEEVDRPMVLSAHDEIELGETTLVFVPFCGEAFAW